MTARTEDQILIMHTKAWFEHSSWSIDRFSKERFIPALQRECPAAEDIDLTTATANEFLKWQTARKQKIVRAYKGSTTFPMHWKWIWIACLDEPYQSQCKSDLLAMAGVLNIPLPLAATSDEKTPVRANVADVMRETADVLVAASPAHDGVYDSNDDPVALARLSDELLDVVSVCLNEVVSIKLATGYRGGRLGLMEETARLIERISKQTN